MGRLLSYLRYHITKRMFLLCNRNKQDDQVFLKDSALVCVRVGHTPNSSYTVLKQVMCLSNHEHETAPRS